jgi:hypothetical protein
MFAVQSEVMLVILEPETPGGFRRSMDCKYASSSATADDILVMFCGYHKMMIKTKRCGVVDEKVKLAKKQEVRKKRSSLGCQGRVRSVKWSKKPVFLCVCVFAFQRSQTSNVAMTPARVIECRLG